MGSMAPTPLRLHATEQVLVDAELNDAAILEARRALASETAPIDDIRSTAARGKSALAGSAGSFGARYREAEAPHLEDNEMKYLWGSLVSCGRL